MYIAIQGKISRQVQQLVFEETMSHIIIYSQNCSSDSFLVIEPLSLNISKVKLNTISSTCFSTLYNTIEVFITQAETFALLLKFSQLFLTNPYHPELNVLGTHSTDFDQANKFLINPFIIKNYNRKGHSYYYLMIKPPASSIVLKYVQTLRRGICLSLV